MYVCLQVLVWEDLSLTHAVFHHHEATLVSLEALAFKISWCVDAPARAAQVRGDAALIDVCMEKRKRELSKVERRNEAHPAGFPCFL